MEHRLTIDPVAAALGGHTPDEEAEIITDEDFSYDGYQVVRGEFFAHVQEPSITFNNCRVALNTACIRKLPTVEYVQILVNPETMKLAVRPCNEDDKDSLLWCTTKNGKRKPKQITCRMFFAKVADMMGWDPENKYRIMGNLLHSNGETLIVFDLSATETYRRIEREGKKPTNSRIPVFPEEWKNQFGLPYSEHQQSMQIDIFDGYAVYTIKDNSKSEKDTDIDMQDISSNMSASHERALPEVRRNEI